MGTFVVILLQLALCGFIAYIGDLLGRRLGKKRLTVFGLRPKHTAILLTVITGIVIAGGTFLAALATVPGFREAVIRGERLAAQNHDLMTANAMAQSQSTRLQSENGTLVNANATLKTGNETLEKQNKQLSTTNDTLKKTNGELEGHNQELRTSNGELLQVKARLLGEKEHLAKQVEALRSENYIFRVRQSLCGSRVIPPNPRKSDLERALEALIYNARYEAKNKHARPENGRPVVAIVTAEGYGGTPGDEQAIRGYVIGRLLKFRDTPLVMRLVAVENAVAGHSVPAKLEWGANEVIFRKGDLLAERDVDGGLPPGAVMVQILNFFNANIRKKADDTRMFSDEPGVQDPAYWDQIMKLYKDVTEMKRPVKMVAQARQDIRRAGPLNLDVKVQPISGSAGL